MSNAYEEFEKSLYSLGRNLTRAKNGYVSELTQAAYVGWVTGIRAAAAAIESPRHNYAGVIRQKFGVE